MGTGDTPDLSAQGRGREGRSSRCLETIAHAEHAHALWATQAAVTKWESAQESCSAASWLRGLGKSPHSLHSSALMAPRVRSSPGRPKGGLRPDARKQGGLAQLSSAPAAAVHAGLSGRGCDCAGGGREGGGQGRAEQDRNSFYLQMLHPSCWAGRKPGTAAPSRHRDSSSLSSFTGRSVSPGGGSQRRGAGRCHKQ